MGGIFHLPLRKPIIESIPSISYHIITRVIMNSIDMIYIPHIDIIRFPMEYIEKSSHISHCPHKKDAVQRLRYKKIETKCSLHRGILVIYIYADIYPDFG